MRLSPTIKIAVLSVLGLFACVGTAVAVAVRVPIVGYVISGVFFVSGITLFLSLWVHPNRAIEGSVVTLSNQHAEVGAPRWSRVMLGVCFALLVLAGLADVVENGGGRHSVAVSQLANHPETALLVTAMSGFVYALSLNLALAARRLRQQLGFPWLPP